MIKAIVIAAQGFQDEEYVYAYYRLLEAGFHVDVATPEGKVMYGKFGVPARPTISIEGLTSGASYDAHTVYDALVIPGGFESPDRLRMREDVQKLVWNMHVNKKIVAAICHAPSICISAGIAKGKRMTGYDSIKQDIINAGAKFIEAEVVRDGNLITSPHYRNNGAFMKTVVKATNDFYTAYGYKA